MPYVESFEEFEARQNCECIKLENGSYIFANGAAFIAHFGDGTSSRLTSCQEPPAEKFALLRAKRVYVAAKLGRESTEYQRALAAYQQRANHAARYPNSCPPVPPQAMDELRAGWDRVEALRQELEQLDSDLAQAPEVVAKRQLAERDAEIYEERKRIETTFLALNPQFPPPPASPVNERELVATLRPQPATSSLFGTTSKG